MSGSGLYVGHVMHRRLRPRMHYLRYRIFSLLLDLDEIDELDRGLRFFSRGRFNLLSFCDRDHGDGSNRPLREQVLAHLQSAGIEKAGRIRLLAMPRLLGFVFNPLSIYFCDYPEGGLAAIIYAVHNTFRERHAYVLPVESDEDAIRQEVAKRFHVSPFLPMDLAYSFRIAPPSKDVRVAITASDPSGPILTAVHSAKWRPLDDQAIMRAVATHPLMTLKVVGAIVWEAGRLLAKGFRVHAHPSAPPASATVRRARPPAPKAKAA